MRKKIGVKGMQCTSCEKLLTLSINEIDGISVQSISYKTGELVIDYEDEDKLEEVKRVIEDNGYKISLQSE